MSDKQRPLARRDKNRIAFLACDRCRLKKLRCDEKRPSCSACSKHRARCVYKTQDLESQKRHLRHVNYILRQKLSELSHNLNHQRVQPKDHASSAPRSVACSLVPDNPSPLTLATCHSLTDESYRTLANAFLEKLATTSDYDSTMLLARLRMGEPIDHIMNRETHSLQMSQKSFQRDQGGGLQSLSKPSNGGTNSHRPWLPTLFDRETWRSSRYERLSLDSRDDGRYQRIASDLAGAAPLTSKEFGNLPFSGAIMANHWPLELQEKQVKHLHIPIWAMETIGDPEASTDPFQSQLSLMQSEILSGTAAEWLCGPHAYMEALFNEAAYNRAPRLSKVVAAIVKSVKPETDSAIPTTTMCALMWVFWSLYRWMLIPSPQTYCDMPPIMRPNYWQVFVPHPRVFDFIVPPALREQMCRSSAPDIRWISEGCRTVECTSNWTIQELLKPDPWTNELDLSITAKAHISDISHWSMGPSAKRYLPDANDYISIRQS
ncbi:hypothetical protein K431DRAFT_285168 [Polychaeton citri CBS 116435]|uniref:Zn(2)-C6 fungal-type domain-containing protein n=1 Tax=Polychaeton citri CBS 116435 TaxID=1314669 RepID=A0A9P4Q5U0_9PEZI|nr:hypothetical protein K431DRAFT_285168 [Polychaeton citri CBS 116435]